jgi:ribonuclease P protein component
MPEGERDGRGSYRSAAPETLRRGSIFREIYRTGRRFRGSAIRVVYRKNALGVIRLGFSVSRKTGSAVERNRFRRRMRSLVRQEGAGLGADIVVSPAGETAEVPWDGMRKDFEKLLDLMEGQ